MYGDGCLSNSGNKYLIYISGHKDDDFIFHSTVTCPLFKKLFEKEVKINFRKNENTLFLRFSDKKIFSFFRSLGLPKGIKYGNLKIPNRFSKKSHFCRFVRGLFSTDGCFVLSKQHHKKAYYPRLEITSKSSSFLSEILERLKIIGFYGSISFKGRGYRLEIPGYKNLNLWVKVIGFGNLKHEKKYLETFINVQQTHNFVPQ